MIFVIKEIYKLENLNKELLSRSPVFLFKPSDDSPTRISLIKQSSNEDANATLKQDNLNSFHHLMINKTPSGGKQKGYTDSQFEKYERLLVELNDWTIDQLKIALKKNEQSSGGVKKDLVAKVADGKVLGKIPKCPKCIGGVPRFDYKAGLYTCPGYRDNDDFKICLKKYTLEELVREAWID